MVVVADPGQFGLGGIGDGDRIVTRGSVYLYAFLNPGLFRWSPRWPSYNPARGPALAAANSHRAGPLAKLSLCLGWCDVEPGERPSLLPPR